MNSFKDQEQATYTANPTVADLSVIIVAYNALLTGDYLPERVAVQTVDLRALLDAATKQTVDVEAVRNAGFREGVEAAAKITDEFKANNAGAQSPEARACFTISKEMGQYIRALSPVSPVEVEP